MQVAGGPRQWTANERGLDELTVHHLWQELLCIATPCQWVEMAGVRSPVWNCCQAPCRIRYYTKVSGQSKRQDLEY